MCKAFRAKGHEAYSCDIQEPSGGHPEWHILGDALEAIKGGTIVTMDGQTHDVGRWDLLIVHPPCTFLSYVSGKHLKLKTNGLPKPDNGKLFGKLPSGKNRTWEDTYSRSGKVRSKTFPGIAKAMAEQGGVLPCE